MTDLFFPLPKLFNFLDSFFVYKNHYMLGVLSVTNEVNNFILFSKKKKKGENIFHSRLRKPLMGLVSAEKCWSRTSPPSSANLRADGCLPAGEGVARPDSGLTLIPYLMIDNIPLGLLLMRVPFCHFSSLQH